jgi:hypothetical protein
MTRRTTRVLWGLLGICLFASAALSLTAIFGAPRWLASIDVRRLEILLDLMALLFWMLVFAFYWTNKK